MKILNSLEKLNTQCVVALGNFDGVHKAHQELILTAVNKANEYKLPSVVFTFNNLPINVITKSNTIKQIFTIEDKLNAFENLGVDYCFCIDFNDYIQHLSPEDFVKSLLVDTFNAKTVVCGFNYSFGYLGKGNTDLLSGLAKECEFELIVMEEYKISSVTVSSTAIRKYLADGKVDKYFEFTGRLYSLFGTVVEGMHLGGRLGFPTLNINLNDKMQLPRSGVYFTKTTVKGKTYNSITNVGNKPSVGDFSKNAETYLLNFNGNLYGEPILVEFLHFLRPETKFDSLKELEIQIEKDCKNALQFFNKMV